MNTHTTSNGMFLNISSSATKVTAAARHFAFTRARRAPDVDHGEEIDEV
ncbi:hypothetical protein [Cryobacterium sp. M25]|nr:hypothetical protein [Cryobacterium sp. M25]